jgi:acyl-CoA thioesterase-2
MIPEMRFADLMELAGHGPDVHVGEGMPYPWGGLYGGHIVAQALRAAAASVDGRYRPHSLRAYFIRPGDAGEPVRYEVDRIRDGRSFCTRRVVARQAAGAILNLESSFQVHEPTGSIQTFHLDGAPGPDGLPGDSWTPMFERRFVPGTDERGRARAWFRMVDPVGEDPLLHACALAYLSDDLPTDAVFRVGPLGIAGFEEAKEEAFSVSLDHTIWFHHPLRADDWHLQDFSCHGFADGRGLAIGHAFAADGTHVATIAQEVLVRRRQK